MSDREPRRATRPAVPMGQFDTSMQTALGTRDGVQNYQERFDAWLDSQPVTFRCSLCSEFVFDGPAGEGRELAAKHRAEKHPGAVSKRRRRPSRAKERERAERTAEQRRKSAAFRGDA